MLTKILLVISFAVGGYFLGYYIPTNPTDPNLPLPSRYANAFVVGCFMIIVGLLFCHFVINFFETIKRQQKKYKKEG